MDKTMLDAPSVMHDAVVVIGAGPAGLMAAQVLGQAGHAVHLFDAMPTPGRKFLLAGKGGLNLTHSEDFANFIQRYAQRSGVLHDIVQAFDADALRAWAQDLGVPTFVGSSGRVFPQEMKSAPLLRAWLQRLRHPLHGAALALHMRHRWTGWDAQGALTFQTPQGGLQVHARAVVFALGGGSWPRLGSDAAWVATLQSQGIAVAPLQPSNCGFDVQGGWSTFFRDKFAGHAFKSVAIRCTNAQGQTFARKGEFVATATGIEGSVVYAASALLREEIAQRGSATLYVDLLPDWSLERVCAEVSHPRGARSLSSHLKSRLRLDGIKSAVLYDCVDKASMAEPERLAQAIKALPIVLQSARPLAEAISSAGGVHFDALTPALMLRQHSGLFCAGEMLDWEAPTGGYLLQACFATGYRAGQGAADYLRTRTGSRPNV